MVSKLSKLWKLIATPETVEKVADASEKVFDLAKTLNDADTPNKISELAKTLKDKGSQKGELVKLVEKIPTLLEALNSPLGDIVKSSIPFLPIATGVIQIAIEANKKEPTVAETVALVSQVAYLESIKEILGSESIFEADTTKQSEEVKKQLSKLDELEISDREARKALSCFHQSKLAKAFNEVLKQHLICNGIDEEKSINYIVQQIASNTNDHILDSLYCSTNS